MNDRAEDNPGHRTIRGALHDVVLGPVSGQWGRDWLMSFISAPGSTAEQVMKEAARPAQGGTRATFFFNDNLARCKPATSQINHQSRDRTTGVFFSLSSKLIARLERAAALD